MSAAAPGPTGAAAFPVANSWLAPEHLPQFRAAFSKIRVGADVAAAHARAGDRRVDDGADPPGCGVEHKDAVGEDQRLVDAVGDEDHRGAGPRPYGEEVLLQLLARLRVERAEGLVHEDENGVAHERARDADPLLHAAGQFMGKMLGKGAKPHQFDEMAGEGAARGRAPPAHLEREPDAAPPSAPRPPPASLEPP